MHVISCNRTQELEIKLIWIFGERYAYITEPHLPHRRMAILQSFSRQTFFRHVFELHLSEENPRAIQVVAPGIMVAIPDFVIA